MTDFETMRTMLKRARRRFIIRVEIIGEQEEEGKCISVYRVSTDARDKGVIYGCDFIFWADGRFCAEFPFEDDNWGCDAEDYGFKFTKKERKLIDQAYARKD